MVIDFHTHVFPEDRAPTVMASMAERARIPSYADGTLEGLLASMAAAGVDASVVSRITAAGGQVPAVNRWLASLRRPGIFVAATLHPEVPDLRAELEWIAASGIRGVKLHPDHQGFRVEEPRMFPIYDALQSLGLWLLIHAGLDRGLPGQPLCCHPRALLEVHRGFPRLTVVAAHMGGEEIYEETEEHLVGTEILLDTSFVLQKMPESTLRRFVAKHSAERVVFGTDSPWSSQREDLEYLLGRPFLTSAEKERIAGANAAALLGLPAA